MIDRFLRLACVCIAVWCCGCGTDGIVDIDTANAIDQFGNIWTGSAEYSENHQQLSLVNRSNGFRVDAIEIRNFDIIAEDTILFNEIAQPNEFLSTINSAIFQTYLGGDQVTEFYEYFFDPNFQSWLKLSNVRKNRFCGEFEISLKLSDFGADKFHEWRPDTMYFTNGKFCARIR